MADPVKTEPVLEPVRNPTATTTGAGAAIVLSWLYNNNLAPHFGLTEMPDPVVIILSVFILDVVRFWMTSRKVVVEEPAAEPEPEQAAQKPHLISGPATVAAP